MTARHHLHLLGEGVRLDGPRGPVPLGDTAAALLTYLALAGPTPRDRMAGLLWPEHGQARARANLRQQLHRLRAMGELVLGEPPRLAPTVVVDAHVLERRARDLAEGVPGEPPPWSQLAPLDVGDRPDLDEWLTVERERFRERVASALAEQADRHASRAAHDLALAAARCWLAFDPFSEPAHRRLVRAHLEADDPRSALSAFRRCRTLLARAFDAEPGAATRALAQRAARLAARPLAVGAPGNGPTRTRRVERVRGDRPADPNGSGTRSPATEASPSPGPLVRRAEAGGWSPEALALLRGAARTERGAAPHGALLVGIAWLEHQRGRQAAARVAARHGLSLLRRGGREQPGIAEALFVLGSLARSRGDDERARRCWSAAIERLSSAHGARAALALHLNMGLVEDGLGAPARAARHYLNALPLAEQLDDRRSLATALNNLGHGLVEAGRPVDGAALLQRAYSIAVAIRDRQLEGYLLDGLAGARLASGEPHRARGLAARALRAAHELDDRALRIEALLTLARTQRALDEPDAAARSRHAAWRLADESGDRARAMRSDAGLPEATRATSGADPERSGAGA